MSDRFPTGDEPRHHCSACGCTRLISPDGKPSVCSGIGCRSITRDLDAEQRGRADIERAMATMKRVIESEALASDVACGPCAGVALRTHVRQARMIRRLRALADGYRAKYKAEYEHHEVTLEEHGLDLRDAKREERARIVAELRARAKYLIDSYGKAQENAAYEIYDLADAIERGEL